MSDFRSDPHRSNDIKVEIPTTMKWIYAGIGAALVLALVAFSFTGERSQTASKQQPGASAPAQTTGSGGASRPMAPAQRP
jgi:hypothetical protein